MVFALPDKDVLLEQRVTSILNFKHIFWLGEWYADIILEKYGFEVEEKSSMKMGIS